MRGRIKISIVIPVKNGRATLATCIEGIRKQTVYDETELILIDSGSTDGTLELIAAYPEVRLIQIPAESFNHGGTRNYGVSLANGEFVVMTVQDAVPAHEDWLGIMLAHFEDPEVAGVCGQQIVPHHSDKNPHEWFWPQSKPSVVAYQYANRNEFSALSPSEKSRLCRWDDVNAMYRRSVLLEEPFQEVMFGEDMLWAQSALLNGHKIIYDTHSRVEHYHQIDFDYQYKRTFTVLYHRYKFFGLVSSCPFKPMDYLKIIYRNKKRKASFRWIPYNFVFHAASRKAYADFEKFLAAGELDQQHARLCKSAPQAGINKKSNEKTFS